jgi:trk system potassium uptake protein TrkA
MGCGRVGSALADALVRIGHEVAVIDQDESAFLRLGPDFTGQRVVGAGFDREVLRKAGIERADAFAAVSSGDNSNIISARVARETFGVERVVARIYDAKRAAVYERIGIPTVATVPWTTDRFLHTQIVPHEQWYGRTVRQLEEATKSRVAFVIRLGEGVLPRSKSVLQDGDIIYVAAVSGTASEAVALASNPPPAED